MLQKLSKKNNTTVQRAIADIISEGLRLEVANLKRLEGDRLKSFIEIFSIQHVSEPEIYYNAFNVLFCEAHIYEQMSSFLKKDSLVLKVEIPKVNINVWCHEMFSDPLIANLLDDLEEGL